jgi:hypothetical protein
MKFRSLLFWSLACVVPLLLASSSAFAQTSIVKQLHQCDKNSGVLCTEKLESPSWAYIGHDKSSLLFYSNEPGSGFVNVYRLKLPKDPPLQPKQDGTGRTWNLQLRPTFWFGMAMCDDQSAPNPGGSATAGPNIKCEPDSDANVYDDPRPEKRDYIGRHPGTAFMEMQFYPPRWITSNSATQ